MWLIHNLRKNAMAVKQIRLIFAIETRPHEN